jgi:hypothetical protein
MQTHSFGRSKIPALPEKSSVDTEGVVDSTLNLQHWLKHYTYPSTIFITCILEHTKHVFRPHFKKHIPMMAGLENMIISVHEGTHSVFDIMSSEDTVYPTSVQTLCMVSMDIDFHKVYLTTYHNNCLISHWNRVDL